MRLFKSLQQIEAVFLKEIPSFCECLYTDQEET